MKDFLILGGNSNLSKNLNKLYPETSISLTKRECDITSFNSIDNQLKKFGGKYILNFAAITDMSICEKEENKCLMVNGYAVGNLLKLSQKYNKKLIHISSNYALFPKNIYGKSKQISEKILSGKCTVIRTSFYSKNNFIVSSLLQNKKTEAYTNVFFNPISINRLCTEILKNKDNKRTINILSTKKISNYDFAKEFSKVFDINPSLIIPKIYEEDKFNRPLDSFIKSDVQIDLAEDLKNFKNYIK